MPDKNNTVWGLDKIAYDCSAEKTTEILKRLQQAVHDNFDGMTAAYEENDKLAAMLQERTQILAAILPFFESCSKSHSIIAQGVHTQYAEKIKRFKDEYEREQKATEYELPDKESGR